MTFAVRLSAGAEDDLERLFDFLLERARTLEELAEAQVTLDALRAAIQHQLGAMPFSFRKAGRETTRRELVVPSGSTGYVVLYEIAGPFDVVVLAVRHQREEDYH